MTYNVEKSFQEPMSGPPPACGSIITIKGRPAIVLSWASALYRGEDPKGASTVVRCAYLEE